MSNKDIERQTILDMKGLVFNDEMKQAIRIMTDYYITADEEAKKRGKSEIEASQIAMTLIVSILRKDD